MSSFSMYLNSLYHLRIPCSLKVWKNWPVEQSAPERGWGCRIAWPWKLFFFLQQLLCVGFFFFFKLFWDKLFSHLWQVQTGHLEGKTLRYPTPASPTQLQSRAPCQLQAAHCQEAFPGPRGAHCPSRLFGRWIITLWCAKELILLNCGVGEDS